MASGVRVEGEVRKVSRSSEVDVVVSPAGVAAVGLAMVTESRSRSLLSLLLPTFVMN